MFSKLGFSVDGGALLVNSPSGVYRLDGKLSVSKNTSADYNFRKGYFIQLVNSPQGPLAIIARNILKVSVIPEIYKFEDFEIIPLFIEEPEEIYINELQFFFDEFPIYAFAGSDYIIEQTFPKVGNFFRLNYAVDEILKDTPLQQLLVTCFTGYVNALKIDNVDISIIARRSPHRMGTRYMRRGLDKDGNAANEVLTSFVMTKDNTSYAFNIHRGSVPLEWFQDLTLKYKPEVIVTETSTYDVHVNRMLQQYDNIHMVNLMKDSGTEGTLTDAFYNTYKNSDINGANYTFFNFSEVCKNMQYQNAQILIESLEEDISSIGMSAFTDEKLIKQQHGIFRINCLDCLDRTNVIQSTITRKAMESIVNIFQIDPVEYDITFRNLWADHGDVLSIQYSGTNAMKRDFTRMGKRTVLGSLVDGVNSLRRYYKNHFDDGFKQSIIDSVCSSILEVAPKKGASKFFQAGAAITGTILLLRAGGANAGLIIGAVASEVALCLRFKQKFICRDNKSILEQNQ